MTNRDLHIESLAFTVLIQAAFAGLVFWTSGGVGEAGPTIDVSEMERIEVSLAYKNPEASRQPQKERRRPRPKKQPTAITPADPEKPPEEKKEPEDAEEDIDFEEQFEKFKDLRQNEDEDLEEGEEVREIGSFDGSEYGYADVNKGDPYLQELVGEVFQLWELPSLEKGSGQPVGCVMLKPDGTIAEAKMVEVSENANIDRSVRLALSRLEKARAEPEKAKPVPAHLLKTIEKPICFRFPVSQE